VAEGSPAVAGTVRYAGVGRRVVAYIIDAFIVSIIGSAEGGAPLTQDQAMRRWGALALPGIVGSLIGLSIVGAVWALYLLCTAWQDPRRQGFHDRYVGSVVVQR
jgi:hypothetical protein